MRPTLANIQGYVLLWTLWIGPSYASTSLGFNIHSEKQIEITWLPWIRLRHMVDLWEFLTIDRRLDVQSRDA